MFNFGSSVAISTPKPITTMSNFSFGTQTSSAPAFGAPPTAKPPFGQAPAFGTTGFGTMAPTQNTGFQGFGPTTTTQSTGFQGFGPVTTTQNTGFQGFGSTATTTTPSLGTGFGFGATPASSTGTIFGGTGFGGFGTTSTTSTAPTFSKFGGTGITSTGMGTGFGAFGSTFGKPPATSASPFMGFGTGIGMQQQSTFQQPGQQQQQQQQQQQLSGDAALHQALFNVSIFNDERDTLIAKLNYVQAMWGSGRAFYSNNAPPVEITPDNVLCRFKTIAYSRIPGKDNKLGHVSIIFNKPISDVQNQQQIIQNLHQTFGNKPNLIINVYGINQINDKTQMIIFVDEKSMINQNEQRRIPATDVSNYLNQAQFNMQLTNMGIESIIPIVKPDIDELEKYLEVPPKGVDPRMWQQAKLDNPNPKEFIPVPIIGFKELKKRVELQESQTELHIQYLTKVGKDLALLKERHASSLARVKELKRRLALLNHNILSIIVNQECTRKVGVAFSPEEEILKNRLENMNATVSVPTQYKGRILELLSLVRLNYNKYSSTPGGTYTIDKESEEDMKLFLVLQQKAIAFLITTLNRDAKILDRIKDELSKVKISTPFKD